MGNFFRRLRGLAGVGVTWGALWAGIGAAVGGLLGALSPELWYWSNPVLDWAIGMGLYGLVSGVGFGAILSLREASKRLQEISLRRVALWGILGAGAVPVLFGMAGMFETGTTLVEILQAMGVTALLGGTFAPGSVAIARRAELREAPELRYLDP